MNLFYFFVSVAFAVALVNAISFAVFVYRIKPNVASQLVRGLITVGPGAIFTAMSEGTRVVSNGASVLALGGVAVEAGEKSEIIALDGSNVLGEAGSATFLYQGAHGRFRCGASAHLYAGVKGYARNGCTVVCLGGQIWNTGDACVFPGNEPAGVVGEAGATLFVHSGATVITEPNVICSN